MTDPRDVPHPYVVLVDEAECSLGSPFTDAQLAERHARRTGKPTTAEEVHDLRVQWSAHLARARGHVRTLRL